MSKLQYYRLPVLKAHVPHLHIRNVYNAKEKIKGLSQSQLKSLHYSIVVHFPFSNCHVFSYSYKEQDTNPNVVIFLLVIFPHHQCHRFLVRYIMQASKDRMVVLFLHCLYQGSSSKEESWQSTQSPGLKVLVFHISYPCALKGTDFFLSWKEVVNA